MIGSPRQHVLERESQQAFESTIPAEWLCRWQPLDYGIDCTVEVANPEEGVTGETFAVQLKATDDEAPPDIPLDTSHLRFYELYPLPVLIAGYSSQGGEVYGRWVHEIVDSMNSERRREVYEQETLTIAYQEDHRLRRDEANNLRTELQEELGRRRLRPSVSIIFRDVNDDEQLGKVRARLSRELRSWADELAPGRIRVIEGSPVSEGPMPVHVALERVNGEVEISLSGREEAQPVLEALSVSRPLADPFGWLLGTEPSLPVAPILVAAAFELGASGDPDSASRILIQAIPACAEILDQMPPLVGVAAMMFGAARRTGEALLLSERLASEEHFEAAASLASSSPFSVDQTISDPRRYQSLLRRCIEGIDRPKALAPLCYNLANSLKGTRNFREAVSFYHLAATHDPSYRDRAYWWEELGGCFFETGHPSWSADAYRQALEVAERSWRILRVRPKYADALAFSGHYQDAINEFESYFGSTDHPEPEWVLKALLLENCVEHTGTSIQVRRPDEAVEFCEEVEQLRDAEAFESARDRIEDGLDRDLLCPLCWYEAEMLAAQEERFEDVHFAELMRAVFGRSLSACVTGTLNGFSSQQTLNQAHLLATLYLMEFGQEAFGSDYVNALRERLGSEPYPPTSRTAFEAVVRLVLDPDYSVDELEDDIPFPIEDLHDSSSVTAEAETES